MGNEFHTSNSASEAVPRATSSAAPLSVRSRRAIQLLTVLAILAAGGIRLYRLQAGTFSAGEIAAIHAGEWWLGIQSDKPSEIEAQFHDAAPDFPVPPFFTGVALRWGYGEFNVRLFSVLAGTLTVAALWAVGAAAFGPEVSLYAVIGLASSPLHVALSRTVGSGVWSSLFATLAVLAFHHASRRSRNTWRWGLFAVTGLLACMSAYSAVPLLAAVVVCSFGAVRRDRRAMQVAVRASIASSVGAAVALVWFLSHHVTLHPSMSAPRLGQEMAEQIASVLATGRGDTPIAGLLLFACVLIGALSHADGLLARLVAAWFVFGVVGVVVADLRMHLSVGGDQVAPALPAYFLLAGAGIAWLRQSISRVGTERLGAAMLYMFAGCLLLLEVPALEAYLQEPDPPWREAAAVVDANARPDDAVVVIKEWQRFLFYAPDLERRVARVTRPGLAPGFFGVHSSRGWLIAPASSRFYPGWSRVESWFRRFPPVNLSPGPGVEVFYVGRDDRSRLLLEAAYFELPTAVLVRGTLLLDLLQRAGPIPPLLWKVDQIALSRQPLEFHNPELLRVVSYLIEHGEDGRAASLAYRLASADPSWKEAQEALAQFRTADGAPARSQSPAKSAVEAAENNLPVAHR